MGCLYTRYKVERERVITIHHSRVGKTLDTPLPVFLPNELAIKSGFIEKGQM